MSRALWIAKFRGFLTFSVFFALLSLAPLLFIDHLDLLVLHNSRPASPWGVFFVWSVGIVIFWAIAPVFSGFYLLSLALVIGGASSNLLYRLFLGPVPDYIPLPFALYGNLPDLMIFSGILAFLFLLLRVVVEDLQKRRELKREFSYERK